MRTSFLSTLLSVALVVTPATGSAELPDGARAMIDAAIATGSKEKVAVALELARSAYPEEKSAIDAISADWNAVLAVREAEQREREEREIRAAGLFDRWKGEGELGGLQSSGNSNTVGATAALMLRREGIDWTHSLRARFDFQRQNGVTSREKYFAAYEPRWQFEDNLFAYGLVQFERDKIQGIDGRYSASGGIGYKVLQHDKVSLAVKAGPAYRVTEYFDGNTENRVGALVGLDFDWRIYERLTLTQDTNAVAETGGEAVAFVGKSNTTLNLITGLDFKVSNKLRARLSYQIDYDSNPPTNKVNTSTLTRASIVQGF